MVGKARKKCLLFKVEQQEQPLEPQTKEGSLVGSDKLTLSLDAETIEWDQNYERAKRYHFYLKVFVFMGGFVVVLSSILMISKG